MTGSNRIFEKSNFTPKLSVLVFLKVKLPNMTDWHKQQIAGIAETVLGCNYCVATIVARPLRTTVKGGEPAFRKEIRALFPRIQESGRVSGLELIVFYINC